VKLDKETVEKRNIVLITLDSVRADHCSFMGYHRETTPTIDKMAKKGLYFENAIAASVPTAPSMFCSFTGQYPLIESLNKNSVDWRKEFCAKETLALKLRQMGYSTIAVHRHPWASKYFGFDKGFDYFSSLLSDSVKVEKKEKMNRFIRTLYNILDILTRKGEAVYWESYYEEIIDVIEKAKRPYFLWVFLLDTHWPYLPPKKYFGSYHLYIDLLYKYWKIGRKKMLHRKKEKIIIDAYDGAIKYADTFIRRLWKDLESDDPIFIIHSDHGDGFGEHGFYYHIFDNKTALYEELIHVPLVIYNADIKGKIEKPFSLLSLSSLIIYLAQMGDKPNEFPINIFCNDFVKSEIILNGNIIVAVRTRRWKFIKSNNNEELYDLKNDPYEQNNVVDEHLDLVREMRNIVKSHIKHKEEIKKIKTTASRLKI